MKLAQHGEMLDAAGDGGARLCAHAIVPVCARAQAHTCAISIVYPLGSPHWPRVDWMVCMCVCIRIRACHSSGGGSWGHDHSELCLACRKYLCRQETQGTSVHLNNVNEIVYMSWFTFTNVQL